MTVEKGKDGSQFDLKGLSLSQLSILKKACTMYAKQGSADAEKIAREIDDAMNNITV